jgi:hypothetical protein
LDKHLLNKITSVSVGKKKWNWREARAKEDNVLLAASTPEKIDPELTREYWGPEF